MARWRALTTLARFEEENRVENVMRNGRIIYRIAGCTISFFILFIQLSFCLSLFSSISSSVIGWQSVKHYGKHKKIIICLFFLSLSLCISACQLVCLFTRSFVCLFVCSFVQYKRTGCAMFFSSFLYYLMFFFLVCLLHLQNSGM